MTGDEILELAKEIKARREKEARRIAQLTYSRSAKGRAKTFAYQKGEKYKAWKAAYLQRPEVRARRREYYALYAYARQVAAEEGITVKESMNRLRGGN